MRDGGCKAPLLANDSISALRLSEGAYAMNWTLTRTKEPPIVPPSRLDRDVEYAKWKHLEPNIEYLILVTNTFIVYVDKALDVDWSLRDNSVEDDNAKRDQFSAVLNRVGALETTPCDDLARNMKIHFKRLVGEGVARGLEGKFDAAQTILDSAALYIKARSEETSRYWYLSGSVGMAFVFALLACVLWISRAWLQPLLSPTAFWVLLSACAGAIGAMLSVINRTGKLHFDCSAGRRLHYLEAASRIWAGAVSGVVVSLAVSAQLFLTALTHGGNTATVMILAALGSGVSERFATSIIADLGTSKTYTKDVQDENA
jgi:hypothetical protein